MTRPFENYTLKSLRADRDEIDEEIARRERERDKIEQDGRVRDAVTRARDICDTFLAHDTSRHLYEVMGDNSIGLYPQYDTGPNGEDFHWHTLVLRLEDQ